jgi:flavin reductase (DIM6/NTAB) family NADH-FMN oxidoreductase RutF
MPVAGCRGECLDGLLSPKHGALASRFAGRYGVKGEARFEEGDWFALVTGAPVLVDALAWLDCRVEEILERHTHAMMQAA